MLRVTGYSDDVIHISGEIHEEFGKYDSEADYLAFSDGTVLSVVNDEDGIWRFKLVFRGALYEGKTEGIVAENTNDIVTFRDGIKWVVCGEYLAK